MKRAGAILRCALLLLAGCSNAAPPWQVRASDENAWFLALAPLAAKVLVAGGQPGTSAAQPGSGVVMTVPDDTADMPLRLSSPQPGMLWWVHALSPDTAWLCGENGSVLRYSEGKSGLPELLSVPAASSATLYGIWAFSDDDVWAVGGQEGGPGVVLHGSRSGLLVDSTVPAVPVLYKLFGADRDHLFAVGQAGTLLRRVGTTWMLDPALVNDRLLTVFGTSASNVYAVGGLGSGRLLAWDGQRWTVDDSVADLDPLAGLYVTAEELLVAGQRGLLARRSGSSGAFEFPPPVTSLDLHGALVRGGARYAVGGNLSQFRLQPPRGVLLEQGAP